MSCCDLCGGERFVDELTAGEWHLVRCAGCGLVLTSPRYTDQDRDILYRDSYYEASRKYLRSQLDMPREDDIRMARALMNRLSGSVREQPPHCLEVGCGGGRMTSAFAEAGWCARGIDINREGVDAGVEKGLDLQLTTVDDPALGLFDLVSAFHVLEHVTSPRSLLAGCASRLREDGLLLLECPDYGCRRSRAMGAHWPSLWPDCHLYQFTRRSLCRYLAETGFVVIKAWHVGGRGPMECDAVEQDGGGASVHRAPGLRDRIFALRRLFYWSPFLRDCVRHMFWELLGYGEFVRILARKE